MDYQLLYKLHTLQFENREHILPIDDSNKRDFYIGYKNQTVFIYFMGTDSALDVISDIRFTKIREPKLESGSYHKGFYLLYQEYSASIKRYISNLEVEKIVIGGHSLGGGLVAPAVVDLQKEFNLPIIASNFSGARGADYNYKNNVERLPNVEFYTFIYRKDIVSHLPFYILGLLQIVTLGKWFYFPHHIGIITTIDKQPFWKLWSIRDHKYSWIKIKEYLKKG